jgi:hypothetical protein
MGQSLTHVLVHAIFSTKDRRPFLHSEEIRNESMPTNGRTSFQGESLCDVYPGLKHPGYFVRPLRGGEQESNSTAEIKILG